MRVEAWNRRQAMEQNARWAGDVAHYESMAAHHRRQGEYDAAEACVQAAERYRLLLAEPIPGFNPPKLPAGDEG